MNLEFLHKHKNTLITIAAVIVVILVIWGIIKFSGISGKVNQIIRENKLDETIDNEINASNVTISAGDAELYAQRLYQAMKGMGTDEDTIYEVFSYLQTRSDVFFLIRTFNIKDGLTLVEWISSELSSSERTKLNSILAGNNINYKF